jgi:hypothetical protein
MGARDKAPRLKRTDVLNARREDWDRWENNNHALEKVRKRLLEIVEDPNAAHRDVLRAVDMIENRGLGKVTEQREQPVSQPLWIMLPQPGGGYERLGEGSIIEGEFSDGA